MGSLLRRQGRAFSILSWRNLSKQTDNPKRAVKSKSPAARLCASPDDKFATPRDLYSRMLNTRRTILGRAMCRTSVSCALVGAIVMATHVRARAQGRSAEELSAEAPAPAAAAM